jgi:hypothetical protein
MRSNIFQEPLLESDGKFLVTVSVAAYTNRQLYLHSPKTASSGGLCLDYLWSTYIHSICRYPVVPYMNM